MTARIIMHNMIIEDERDLSTPIKEFNIAPALSIESLSNGGARFNEFLA